MNEIASFFAPAAAPASGGTAVAPTGKSATASVFSELLAQLQGDGIQGQSATANDTDILQQLLTIVTPKTNSASKVAAQLSASAILDEAVNSTANTTPDANALQGAQNSLAIGLDTTQLTTLLQTQIAAQAQPGNTGAAIQNATDGKPAGKPTLTAEQLKQLTALNTDATGAAASDPKFAQLLAGAIAAQGHAAAPPQAHAMTPKHQPAANGVQTANPDGTTQTPATAPDAKAAISSASGTNTLQGRQQSQNPSLDFSKTLDATVAGLTGYVPAQQGFTTELMKAQTPQPVASLVPLDALAVQIARKFDEGSSQFEISLHPADLGKLDISLNVSQDGRVHAVLRAERAETLDLLRQDARSLETQLRQAGLDVSSNSLSFQLSQGGNQRQNAKETSQVGQSTSTDEISTAADVTRSTYYAVRRNDGLDIHV